MNSKDLFFRELAELLEKHDVEICIMVNYDTNEDGDEYEYEEFYIEKNNQQYDADFFIENLRMQKFLIKLEKEGKNNV